MHDVPDTPPGRGPDDRAGQESRALAWQYGLTSIVQLGPDPETKRLTDSRGIDVACVDMTSSDAPKRDVSDSHTSGARGAAENVESALRILRPGGTLLSVGVSCVAISKSPWKHAAPLSRPVVAQVAMSRRPRPCYAPTAKNR